MEPFLLNYVSLLDFTYLSHNDVSGFIPYRVGNLSGMKVEPPKSVQHEGQLRMMTKGSERKYFTTLYLVNLLDFSSTNLSAEIPVELTSLVHLGTLNLSHNHLVGKIPEEIRNFEWLETLDLSKKKLSGSIPPSMASLIFMNHLNLSYNNLFGEIPNTNQFQTLNDPSIYEGNLALCGDPLPKKCPENGGRSPVPRGDDEDEDEDDKLWLFISAALGFIAGFWGFFCSSIIKKSWRDAHFQFVDKTVYLFLTFISLNVARLLRKY